MKQFDRRIRPLLWGLLFGALAPLRAEAQTTYPAQNMAAAPAYCPLPATAVAAPAAGTYGPNGYDITARGELRVLIIYAGFTNDNDLGSPYYQDPNGTNPWPEQVNGQPATGHSLPKNVAGGLYTSFSQFSPTATDQGLSNFYYQMSRFSGNPLKMVATVYPKRINVTADNVTNRMPRQGFEEYTRRVMQVFKNDPATRQFDFSQVDRRTNNRPNYEVDNSAPGSDHYIDYTLIVWRNTGTPYGTLGPVVGGSGGWASVPTTPGIASLNTPDTYTIDVGFTHTIDMNGIDAGTFTHEFGHSLFLEPHFFGANGVSGQYLYATEGPGMMGDIRTLFSANAWERWINGWAELVTGPAATNGDVQGPAALAATNGLYTLRDYVTTGDMMRISIPRTNQHLWLENHQGKSEPFDKRYGFAVNGLGQPFQRPLPRGILALVENMNRDRTTTPLDFFRNYFEGANALKLLSAQGNFDYTYSSQPITTDGNYWHLYTNPLYDMRSPVANPFGGQSQVSKQRLDGGTPDNLIKYVNTDGNSYRKTGPGPYDIGDQGTDRNEWFLSSLKDNFREDGLFGPDAAFSTVGQKMGNSYNPAIFMHQPFDEATQKLAPITLNGLSVEVVAKNANGDITVKVRYDDVAIVRNTRWTGELRLPDLPETANAVGGYDLTVSPNVILTLDKSGTSNRSTKTSLNDFINPTSLTLVGQAAAELGTGAQLLVRGPGTSLVLTSGSTLMTRPSSQLSIGPGSLLELQSGSRLTVKGTLPVAAGGTLLVRSGATLFIEGAASIPAGAYICLEQGGSIVRSSSTNGTLTVDSGAIQGTNPALGLTTQACGPPTTTCSPLFITGTYRSLDYPGGRVSTLNQSNFADPGTYEVTLDPASAVFEPWYFDANYAASAYNTDNNRRAEITVNVNGQVSVSVNATNCSTGSRSFNFNSNVITNVAPNPTSDELRIEAAAPDSQTQNATATEAPSFEVSLHNAYGQAVRTAKSQKGKIKLSVRDLPAGLYTLRTSTGMGKRVKSEHIQITH